VGEDVSATGFTYQDRQRYRTKVQQCLDVFALMLAEARFDGSQSTTGMEVELNLVDESGDPAMRNAEVLESIANPDFQTELAQFNMEINVPPWELGGTAAQRLETRLRASLNDAEARAGAVGAHIVMIGILPTLTTGHLTEKTFSANPRYALLNQQILAARGEEIVIDIAGLDALSIRTGTIAPEAACTSVQLHLQVSPQSYADNWNAAQSIAGIQVALGANSPFLFGRQLWSETRIPLFEQATDTRPVELKVQGVRPRVWFGDRWITSVFDQFEENLRYFPAMLPICDDEDPATVLEGGGTPRLAEMRMHNGTIYRWNRPVYDIAGDQPHLRVENRVLPAGPTVVDILANAAFYYGTLHMLAEDDRPIWTRMSFDAATDNFLRGARDGIHAQIFWPGVGQAPATEVVLRQLLPLAHEGLTRRGVAPAVRDRLLGIIEQRCIRLSNGAEWQVRTFHHLRRRSERDGALRAMLRTYIEHMHSNEPVHTWPVPD
jgi:gamma-glutamyl:cysteine ligase YbdK (ATP-grasp superfamily)